MPVTETELSNELREVALQVHNAEERKEDRELVAAAHHSVARVAEHYRELMASLSEIERMKLERVLGRRITDLKRMASLLPRIGSIAGSTPDRQVDGASVAGERKITGVSWGAGQRYADTKIPPALRVGGEVEAWCGPCGELKTHHIIAMIGNEPKQVVCQTCNSRHNFRTTPARKNTQPGDEAGARAATYETESGRKTDRKADELRALSNEVATAEVVRDFDPKERYRVGDIISHAEYGRGKVDSVLRSSILVRFARGGLKSLMLV